MLKKLKFCFVLFCLSHIGCYKRLSMNSRNGAPWARSKDSMGWGVCFIQYLPW